MVQRLNYIGSKYNLLEWIETTIKEVTGLESLRSVRVADIFAGTGIVSHYFRTIGSIVISNDTELYSSIITRALATSVYTDRCRDILAELNATTEGRVGYVTTHYSPHGDNERMFFTEENAKRIDFLRTRLEEIRPTITDSEYTFLLASLLVSADHVSNVPAVYGCYLKNFKERAVRPLELVPIHENTDAPAEASVTYNEDVLTLALPQVDVAYLDPPYNERQYSKNYFPLNIIAKTPEELEREPELKGKTGIPQDCFLSPFCRKREVANAFDQLFQRIPARWIFLSYSSEGILPIETLRACMEKYGTVVVKEHSYKRFKSFEYNESAPIKEYLLCLTKGQ